ncbi:MAG: hypothetical protein R3C53_01205 [Pirellulaceae bacterium]
MNNMNFFGWIRDGVRQSVLLGVSDAVEQLGTPPQGEEINTNLAGLLRSHGSNHTDQPKIASAAGGSPKGRKRLGKSLKDIGPEVKT